MTVALAIAARRAPAAGVFQSWALRMAPTIPLFGLLVLQAIGALTLRNTAFQDEALYLYAGRQIFDHLLGGPAPIGDYASYFSGLPYLYPMLAGVFVHAIADPVAALEATRDLSLGLMLCTTAAVYLVTRHLFDRISALLAAALFAGQGSVLFLSHFATYDALCLALLAFATVLALRVAAPGGWLLAPCVGTVLLLAIATKYVGILFVPTVLFILAWQVQRALGWKQALLRMALALGVMVLGATIALRLLDPGIAAGIEATTTQRVVTAAAQRSELLRQAALLSGALLVIGIAGTILGYRKHGLLILALFGSGLLAPTYHIYKAELVSMHKHIAFGLFFVAPLAGYAVARLGDHGRNLHLNVRWLAASAVCMLVFNVGIQQAQAMFNVGWPESNRMTEILRTQVRPSSSRILVQTFEVAQYYLQDVLSPEQTVGLDYFDYTDSSGRHLVGGPAYKAAVRDGYFDAVVLTYPLVQPTARLVERALLRNAQYRGLATSSFPNMPYSGYYKVWIRTDARTQPAKRAATPTQGR